MSVTMAIGRWDVGLAAGFLEPTPGEAEAREPHWGSGQRKAGRGGGGGGGGRTASPDSGHARRTPALRLRRVDSFPFTSPYVVLAARRSG